MRLNPVKEETEVLGVPVLNKIGLLLILFSLGFFGKKEKVDVPRIQRAVVIENQAIVYAQPNFDAKQIMQLSNNKIIAISTQVYRPKNLFGSFYRIFINKPHKVRGYISEIDVLPQYKKTKEGYVLNEKYQNKEQALKQVKTDLLRPERKKSIQTEPKKQEEFDENLSEQSTQEEKSVEQKEVQSSKDSVKGASTVAISKESSLEAEEKSALSKSSEETEVKESDNKKTDESPQEKPVLEKEGNLQNK